MGTYALGMASWVGEFASITEAARALHRDPSMLPRLRTAWSDDPAVYESALKRELFAILAHFSELVMQDIESASVAHAGPLGLALIPDESGEVIPIDEDMLAAASFQPKSDSHLAGGDFFQQVANLQINQLKVS